MFNLVQDSLHLLLSILKDIQNLALTLPSAQIPRPPLQGHGISHLPLRRRINLFCDLDDVLRISVGAITPSVRDVDKSRRGYFSVLKTAEMLTLISGMEFIIYLKMFYVIIKIIKIKNTGIAYYYKIFTANYTFLIVATGFIKKIYKILFSNHLCK